jgi:hypothetical protein
MSMPRLFRTATSTPFARSSIANFRIRSADDETNPRAPPG